MTFKIGSPRGEDISHLWVGNYTLAEKQLQYVTVDWIYLLAATAEKNLPVFRAHTNTVKAAYQDAQRILKDYFSSSTLQAIQALEHNLIRDLKAGQTHDARSIAKSLPADLKPKNETTSAVKANKCLVTYLESKLRYYAHYRQLRWLQFADTHYQHYHLFKTVQRLWVLDEQDEVDPGTKQSIDQEKASLVTVLDQYSRKMTVTDHISRKCFLRRKSELGVDWEGVQGIPGTPYVLYHPDKKIELTPENIQTKAPLAFLRPGLMPMTSEHARTHRLERLVNLHSNRYLAEKARIEVYSLNEAQQKAAFGEQDEILMHIEDDDDLTTGFSKEKRLVGIANTDEVSVDSTPLSTIQKVFAGIGLVLNTGFTLIGVLGLYAGLSMVLSPAVAAGACGVLFCTNWWANKDDFYDQLLDWGKYIDKHYSLGTLYNAKGLMQYKSKRMLFASVLYACVGLELFTTAMHSAPDIIEGGSSLLNILCGQVKPIHFLNPLFYVVASFCVVVSFFMPATAWTRFFGMHLCELDETHQFDVKELDRFIQSNESLAVLAAESQDADEFCTKDELIALGVEQQGNSGQLICCQLDSFQKNPSKDYLSLQLRMDVETQSPKSALILS